MLKIMQKTSKERNVPKEIKVFILRIIQKASKEIYLSFL
jgi:hypothetical protein